MQLIDEVGLQSTTYTTILQCNKRVVLLTNHSALLNERCINIYLSYIVDYNRKANAVLVSQNTVEECRLAAAEVACQQQNRCFINR